MNVNILGNALIALPTDRRKGPLPQMYDLVDEPEVVSGKCKPRMYDLVDEPEIVSEWRASPPKDPVTVPDSLDLAIEAVVAARDVAEAAPRNSGVVIENAIDASGQVVSDNVVGREEEIVAQEAEPPRRDVAARVAKERVRKKAGKAAVVEVKPTKRSRRGEAAVAKPAAYQFRKDRLSSLYSYYEVDSGCDQGVETDDNETVAQAGGAAPADDGRKRKSDLRAVDNEAVAQAGGPTPADDGRKRKWPRKSDLRTVMTTLIHIFFYICF